MKRLIIVGAGGFGREVLGWIRQSNIPHAMEVGGFLDRNPNAIQGFGISLPILGNPAAYMPADNDCFVCAIGDPATKLRICDALEKRGGNFISYFHPTAIIGPQCSVGSGCVLCPYSIITANVTLGRFVTLNLAATVGHDAVIGDGATLSCHCDITGAAKLGTGVFLGSHASVLPKASVGDFATIGAGSVVLRKVKAYATVMGVPAKQMINTLKAGKSEFSK